MKDQLYQSPPKIEIPENTLQIMARKQRTIDDILTRVQQGHMKRETASRIFDMLHEGIVFTKEGLDILQGPFKEKW